MALAVILGAFGAHALKPRITPHYLDVFETASRYHFIHGLGMMATIFFLSDVVPIHTIGRIFLMFLVGIVLFSGSLYILSIADLIGLPQLKFMGAITPIGGVFFVLAWSYSALSLWRAK